MSDLANAIRANPREAATLFTLALTTSVTLANIAKAIIEGPLA